MGLIIYPGFKPPPQTTLANVPENITAWKKNKEKGMLKQFTRPTTVPGGLRFVDSTDLTETIRTEQWFKRKAPLKNLCVQFIFIRRYHWTDHFCPLYFSHWYTEIICHIRWTYTTFLYQSDAHLKRMLAAEA